MPKTKISEYDSTAANNLDIDSISIGEMMPASSVNDAIRELMAHVKNADFGTILADTISESTAANGVVVDGLTIKDGGLPGVLESGTKMLFKQNSAPTGWTFVAEDDDSVLINDSTEANGGTTGGSWTISDITSAEIPEHILTISEMPAHTHQFNKSSATGSSYRMRDDASVSSGTADTLSTGGGGPHTHDAPAITHTPGWRPAYVKVITCTKD